MSRTGGGKEVLTTAAVAVGVGVGVAALAGLGLAGAALGAGTLIAANNSFARRARPAAQPGDVRRNEEGRIENWPQLLKAVQHGGVAPELRATLWPLLLGVYLRDSTQKQQDAELERLRRLYIKLVLVCRELDTQLQALRGTADADADGATSSGNGGGPPVAGGSDAGAAEASVAGASARSEAGSDSAAGLSRPSPPPLPGNLAAFAEAHRIIVMDAVRTDLRRGPAQPNAAIGGTCAAQPTLTVLPVAVGDGLPELMLVSPPEPGPPPASSDAELAAAAADPAAAAALGARLPRWRSLLARDMLWGSAHLDDDTRGQMLRLVNVLSAYAVHDPETGYCQGMSDLASVFVQLFDDDALAFACFERLMRGARRNFRHDETGIRHQLHQIARVLSDTDPSLFSKLRQLGAEDCMFAYRMVVVMLRRELPPAACCTLWEMQWAHEAAELEAGARRPDAPLRSISSDARNAAAGSSSGNGFGAAAGLRSTVQGLSEATAAARASADGGRLARSASGGSPPAAPKPAATPEAPEFVLQFIAAVVRAQRARILLECREHDDVLRLFNSLTVEFWLAAAQARKQHRAYASSAGGAAGGAPLPWTSA